MQKYFGKINPKWIIIALMIAVQWYSYGSGLMTIPDSDNYVHASLSFKNHFSVLDKAGNLFLFWPPLFPVFLSVMGTGKSLVFVHLIIATLIALLVFDMTNSIFEQKIFRWLCCVNILLGIHLLLIATFLLSELLFLLLMLVFLNQFIKSLTDKRALSITIVSGFLMCLQRNAGMFIIAGVSLSIFLQDGEWLQKFKKASFLFFVTSSGALCWNVYVWVLQPNQINFYEVNYFKDAGYNLIPVVRSMINTYLPIVSFHFSSIVVVLCFVVFLFLLYKFITTEKSAVIKMYAIVFVVYLMLFTVVLMVNIGEEPVERGETDRYISVIIPLISICVFKALENFYLKQKTQTRKTLVLIVVLCGMIYPLSRTVNNAILWHKALRAE